MVILGGNDSMQARRRRRFGFFRMPKLRLQNVLIGLIFLFALRNFLRNDSQQEGHQKEGGLTKEEVLQMFPQVKENKAADVAHMKDDIARLKEEVKSLRASLGKSEEKAASVVKDVREEVLKQMDEIHLQKRKAKDEQLEKEHPDFHPTRKMRGP
eukprot:scaffold874_cov126-Cylindrotheca_fusiformis.AAC.3